MFGEQHDSRKPSAPVFGFGSSDRKALERVFISTDHNKADFGKLGPGHIYDVTPGFGKQVSSKNVNPPAFSFGTASRFLRPSAERAKRKQQPLATQPSPRRCKQSHGYACSGKNIPPRLLCLRHGM